MITDLFAAANITMGLICSVLNFRYWRVSTEPWKWIKAVYAILGLIWAVIYLIAITFYDANLGPLGPTVVRVMISITLAAMTSGAIIRAKS
jgi:hypothetical protein